MFVNKTTQDIYITYFFGLQARESDPVDAEWPLDLSVGSHYIPAGMHGILQLINIQKNIPVDVWYNHVIVLSARHDLPHSQCTKVTCDN